MATLKLYYKARKKIFNFLRSYLIETFFTGNFYIRQKGYCPCCEKKVVFESYDNWLRDNFICTSCKSIPRERVLMLTIEKYYPNWRGLVIHETSPVNRGASLKLKNGCKNYIATQYFSNEPFGSIVNNFRNENLENQTFEDESFDLIISQDVMEHVYDPKKAFSEIARTLKKGGAHIFTVPLINKFENTEIWAVLGDDGKPHFLKEAEYHGNPVDPKGSPVTMHWGYDIVDFIKDSCGLDTEIEYVNNLNYGIWAEYIEALVTIKN